MGVILTEDEQYEAYARGRETRRVAREIVRLRDIAKRKRVPTREELTPPIQSDAERGSGNSINARLHRLLRGSLVILLLAGAVQAQEPKYTWVDGALTAGWAGVALGDRWSTNRALTTCPTCREASPFKSANTRMAIQFSLLGATELLQHKYPEHRTKFRWLKVAVIGLGVGVIVNNLGKAK